MIPLPTLIEEYLALVEAVLESPTEANIDAVEAFEGAHPFIADAAYAEGQKNKKTYAVVWASNNPRK